MMRIMMIERTKTTLKSGMKVSLISNALILFIIGSNFSNRNLILIFRKFKDKTNSIISSLFSKIITISFVRNSMPIVYRDESQWNPSTPAIPSDSSPFTVFAQDIFAAQWLTGFVKVEYHTALIINFKHLFFSYYYHYHLHTNFSYSTS